MNGRSVGSFALFLLVAVSPLFAQPVLDPNSALRKALQAELIDFDRPGWDRESPTSEGASNGLFQPDAGPAVNLYREHLRTVTQWQGTSVWHKMGSLALVRPGHVTERLGVNVFRPAGTPRGTLLFVHGYLSHSANFAFTFAWFVNRGWEVVTLDLPGHGFSTGERGDVSEFSEYGDAVETWLKWNQARKRTGPLILLAHSMGAAASFEALRRPGAVQPDKVIFCAPLLRPCWYPALALGQAVTGWFLRTVPSSFGWDGYLDGYEMPVHWFEALGRWLETLDGAGPWNLPLTIYAGDRDSVVDTGWNCAEYARMVPKNRTVILAGKEHLFLSSHEDREEFHRLLADENDL